METTLFKVPKGFPRELLHSSVESREEFFKEHFAGHELLMRAFWALEASVFMPTIDGAVYRVFGPSGVGKSTVCTLLQRRCHERMAPLLAETPDRLACLYCRVPRYERGFDWCDLYARLLAAAGEPFIDQRIPLSNRDGLDPRRKTPYAETRRMAGMRQSVESMLKQRRPAAVLLDEAQHIGYVSSGHSLYGQHDILKSIAEETGVPIVLFGTYELIHFTGLSGQLARRGTRTHLPRYHGYIKKEAEIFQSVIVDFENHLPLPERPDLISHWSFLYEGSVGLVGVLKVWLMRALRACHELALR